MKERIAALTGKEVASRLWMGTFHSVFARILRVEAEHLKFPSSFTIYDTADSKSLIKSILKELQITDKEYKPGLILSRISAAKNDLRSEEHTSELQSRPHLVCRLLLE